MKVIRLHPTRRRVYELLVDGVARGAGLAPTSIIDVMNKEGKITKQRVYQIVRELAEEGYVRAIEGTSLYTRGRNSAMLDDLINAPSKEQVNPSNGGGPIAHYWRKEDNNALNTPSPEAFIPTAEAHINGRYIYPVLRVGELYEPFRVRDPDTGEIAEVRVWEAEPRQLKGVQYYCGRVPLYGGINVQYWDSQTSPAIHIWPTPVELIPGHVADAESDLAAKAQDVANWLGRFGGWRLGVPRFSSNEDGPGIHYACNDPAIVGNFPEGFKAANDAGYWLDSTPPPRAFETTDAERMDGVINYAAITRDLKQGQAKIAQGQASIREEMMARISNKELQMLQLRENFADSQIELWQAVNDLSAAHLATIQAKESGGMYQ